MNKPESNKRSLHSKLDDLRTPTARSNQLAALLVAIWCALSGAASYANSVNVVGLFQTRAVISINGGAPKTMSIGQSTEDGIKLINVGTDSATFEIDGKRQVLRLGQYVGSTQSVSEEKVVLKVAQGGHFFADAKVNGGAIKFMVDTGATMIAISADDARRLGINYLSAPTGRVSTANGSRTVWKVKLDTVSIGAITLNNIDATVLDGGLTMPLLGNSFLSRTSMQHDGDTLIMMKRF